jgi:hypothetical protein
MTARVKTARSSSLAETGRQAGRQECVGVGGRALLVIGGGEV